ncbi:hypothetical protein [Oceanisphaera sp. W20_SRM_FM3]|uniref:hypothetical protein n=1 Tax=Oceanisphaera sp. W20_SRM_FM3 TaxID=3240267 RepID=UPI003F99E164
MIEIIIGAVIGAIIYLIVAELYHRRASKEMSEEIERLAALNEESRHMLGHALSMISTSAESTELIKQHAVIDTPDDPEYPYK